MGDKKALCFFITKLCSFAKSRIANDLLCIVRQHPAYVVPSREFRYKTKETLAEIYLNPNHNMEGRALAACYLCGVDTRNARNLIPCYGSWRRFLSLHQSSNYPEGLLKAMRRSIVSGEGHAKTLALSWELSDQYKDSASYKNEVLEQPVIFGEWPSEAYDTHTHVGKLSYGHILSSNNPIADFIKKHIKEEHHLRALRMGVFSVEGILLEKREAYPDMETFSDMATDAYMAKSEISRELKKELFEVLIRHFELVHAARKRVLMS